MAPSGTAIATTTTASRVPFWDAKIARNRARGERVNAELREGVWQIVRLRDFEV